MRVVGKITPTSRTQIRVKMEYFAKIIQKKGPPIRKKIGNFSPRYSSNYILNEKKKQKNTKMGTIEVFLSKIKTFFFTVLKNGTGGLPCSPSCAPLSLSDYASISLNMPKYS